VVLNFHQDVWSRVTGGDGHPLWLFDKVGLDYTKFDVADAAIICNTFGIRNIQKTNMNNKFGQKTTNYSRREQCGRCFGRGKCLRLILQFEMKIATDH